MKNKEFIKESGQEIPDAKEDLEFRAEKLKRYLEAARKVLGETTVHARILEFKETVEGAYPNDYNKYYAYHVLIGSGGEGTASGKIEFTEFDFPEKEVENFIDQLEDEILDKSREQD